MLSEDTTQTPATYIVTGVASFPSPTIAAQLSPDAAQTVPSPTAAEDVAESPVPTPDKTPTPMPPTVIIITATPGYTPTETPLVTFTPNATPLLSSVTPQSDARITITALDDQISDALTPVNPRTTFEAGITRIYLFVRFRNMTPGVLWKRLLYRGGEPIDGSTYLWGSETGGETYFFFGNDSGFPPGDYEIRLYIGENSVPISTTTFTITE